MYARVTNDLARCVYKIAVAELVNLLMQIAYRLRCSKESVLSLWHRECSCVGGLTCEFKTVVEHAQHAVNNADIVARIFKDWSLLDVCFKHILITLWVEPELLVALETRLFECISERLCAVENAL